MIRKKLDFSKFRLSGKLCVNFHSVAVKGMLRTIRLLAKLGLPVRVSNKTVLKLYFLKMQKVEFKLLCLKQ